VSMHYRPLGYKCMEYQPTVTPWIIKPEPTIVKIPLTAITAKNVIGKKVLPAGGGFTLGDYYFLHLKPKDSGTQEIILISGASGSGKSVIARLLAEIMWFNGFTPIFVVSRKADWSHFDLFNDHDGDIRWMVRHFPEWIKLFTGRPDFAELGGAGGYKGMKNKYKYDAIAKSFFKHKFHVETLYPAYANVPDNKKYYLNPRLLDVYQLAEWLWQCY